MNKKLKKRLKKMESMLNRLESLDWECTQASKLRAKLVKQEKKLQRLIGEEN